MDASLAFFAAPVPVAALAVMSDHRARDVPLSLPQPGGVPASPVTPASTGQLAAVAQTQVSLAPQPAALPDDVPEERLLKPFGLTMLPYQPVDEAIRLPDAQTPAARASQPAT